MAITTPEITRSPLLKFFVDQIKDIYWAEKYLVGILPKMKKSAASPELRDAFELHLQQTREHVIRVEEIFDLLGETQETEKCEDVESLVEETETVVEETEDGSATRDVGLIISAQKLEHYEIATYSGLAQVAKTLGLDDIKEILDKTLLEERETDELLSSIAENINYEATFQ